MREHKKLFYNCDTKQWCRPADNDHRDDDSSEFSGIEFEGIDTCVESSGQPEDSTCRAEAFDEMHQGLDFDDCFDEVDSPSAESEPVIQLNRDDIEG